MTTSVEKLKTEIQVPVAHSGSKVTIVGVGQVGMACAFSIMTQVNILFKLVFISGIKLNEMFMFYRASPLNCH